MAIKLINPKVSLLLLTLSLLLLPSHSYKRSQHRGEEEQSPEGELFECFLSCGERRENEHELTHCEQRCVERYEERKREEGGGDESSFAQIEEPSKVYERCQSGCDKQHGSRLQDQCRRTCQHQYGEMRKHQRRDCGCGHPECSRGGDCDCGHPDCRCGSRAENHHHPVEEQYKECRSRCGSKEERQERQRCEKKCQGKFEKHKREQSDGGENGNPYFFDSHWSH